MPLTIENNRGHDVGIETLHASLDAGCRHIDTAWAYYTPGEEEQTGEKLVREALDSWKGPREEVTVATKEMCIRDRKYNTQTEVVPTNIIAGLFHFEQAPYFQVDEADRQVPQVKF